MLENHDPRGAAAATRCIITWPMAQCISRSGENRDNRVWQWKYTHTPTREHTHILAIICLHTHTHTYTPTHRHACVCVCVCVFIGLSACQHVTLRHVMMIGCWRVVVMYTAGHYCSGSYLALIAAKKPDAGMCVHSWCAMPIFIAHSSRRAIYSNAEGKVVCSCLMPHFGGS